MIVSGDGGQVGVSLRDVVLSQLNYEPRPTSTTTSPRRHPFGAHSFYVPGTQLFPTADGHRHSSSPTEQEVVRRRGRYRGFPTMAERSARRDEVLAVVTRALATDTAVSWEARCGRSAFRVGGPVTSRRSTPPRRSWCRRGKFRLVAGDQDRRIRCPSTAGSGARRPGAGSVVVVDDHRRLRHAPDR